MANDSAFETLIDAPKPRETPKISNEAAKEPRPSVSPLRVEAAPARPPASETKREAPVAPDGDVAPSDTPVIADTQSALTDFFTPSTDAVPVDAVVVAIPEEISALPVADLPAPETPDVGAAPVIPVSMAVIPPHVPVIAAVAVPTDTAVNPAKKEVAQITPTSVFSVATLVAKPAISTIEPVTTVSGPVTAAPEPDAGDPAPVPTLAAPAPATPTLDATATATTTPGVATAVATAVAAISAAKAVAPAAAPVGEVTLIGEATSPPTSGQVAVAPEASVVAPRSVVSATAAPETPATPTVSPERNTAPPDKAVAMTTAATAVPTSAKADLPVSEIPVVAPRHRDATDPTVTAAPFDATAASAAMSAPAHALVQHVSAPSFTVHLNAAATLPMAIPMNALAVEISAQAQIGRSRFEIRLDPPELGRIDVRLDVGRDGQVISHLTVEKPETLDLLRRDAPQLQRALEDAGLKTNDNTLQFSLKDQSHNTRDERQSPRPSRQLIVNDDTVPVETAGRLYGRPAGSAGGVDIRI